MDANLNIGKTYAATVEGMTCGNCALTISRLLERKGMRHISANAASGEVAFTAPDETNVETVYDAIDALGYKVVREGDVAHDHDHHDHAEAGTILLIICAILTVPLLAHMFTSWSVLHNPWVQLALATPVYAIGCYVFIPSAWRSLKHGLPNMDVLIILGASAAFIYSLIGLLFVPEQAHHYLFFETTASIITLVLFGNWLEHATVKSTTVAIDALVKLQPQKARLVMTDSIGKESITEIETKYVRSGDVVLVNTGDSIPVDGEIIQGIAEIDERMITGESLPASKTVSDDVVGGTTLLSGSVRIKATAVGTASVLSSIVRMVREAQAAKPPLQKLADRISAIFVPLVLGIAVVTLLANYFFVTHSFPESMMRAIAVLVIACPCAMGLATPAAIAVGLGRAARNGMLIKGGDTLERMKGLKTIVFDKTGTLTTGNLQIESFETAGMPDAAFKQMVATLEAHSSHPIAQSISRQWKGEGAIPFTNITEEKGRGMTATDSDGNTWQLGSKAWLHGGDNDTDFDLYLYKNKIYQGGIRLSDTLRDDAKETIATLNAQGYQTVLLSGDRKEKCEHVASQLGISQVYCEQSPQQKNDVLDHLMQSGPTAMVGDGINDAPALARATVGISLSESSNIAIQSANIILSANKLSVLPKAIRLGIYTEQTIRQNLGWAFLYNVVAIPVAASGYLTPTWGAAIMALSDVVLVLNSLRLGIRRI